MELLKGKLDEAGRAIAGLIGYNPGPGIYSRLERAVEAMPANVRVQELPGLIKRHKEGVPGWEIREVLTPDLTEGVKSIPRQDLLDAVKERSPVHTHREIVLGGTPQTGMAFDRDEGSYSPVPVEQDLASRLGRGVHHGPAQYKRWGQGGKDYAELLLTQPGAAGSGFHSHWSMLADSVPDAFSAVAHARYDTHGDALRINELQSDLGINNRKARAGGQPRPQLPTEADDEYAWAMSQQGYTVGWDEDGPVVGPMAPQPFPLEDSWADLLIKRLALEAARRGHRAIEVASPAAVFAKTGNELDGESSLARMQHFYGHVVPGALERLGRKMGGLELVADVPDAPTINTSGAISSAVNDAKKSAADAIWRMRRRAPGMGPDTLTDEYDDMVHKMQLLLGERHSPDSLDRILSEQYGAAYRAAVQSLTQGNMQIGPARKVAGTAMGQLIEMAKTQAALGHRLKAQGASAAMPPGRRYIMSDEMRKRILTQGIGAAVAAPIMSDEDLTERLNQ